MFVLMTLRFYLTKSMLLYCRKSEKKKKYTAWKSSNLIKKNDSKLDSSTCALEIENTEACGWEVGPHVVDPGGHQDVTDVEVADDRGWFARQCDAVERDGSQEVHAVDTVFQAQAVKLPSRSGHREPGLVVGLDKKCFEAEKRTQERAGDSSVGEEQSYHSVIRWDVVD